MVEDDDDYDENHEEAVISDVIMDDVEERLNAENQRRDSELQDGPPLPERTYRTDSFKEAVLKKSLDEWRNNNCNFEALTMTRESYKCDVNYNRSISEPAGTTDVVQNNATEPIHQTIQEVWTDAQSRGIPMTAPQTLTKSPQSTRPKVMRSISSGPEQSSPKRKSTFKDKFKFPKNLFRKPEHDMKEDCKQRHQRSRSHDANRDRLINRNASDSTTSISGSASQASSNQNLQKSMMSLASSGYGKAQPRGAARGSSQSLSPYAQYQRQLSGQHTLGCHRASSQSMTNSDVSMATATEPSAQCSFMDVSVSDATSFRTGSSSMASFQTNSADFMDDGSLIHSNADFIESLRKLKDIGWYWGPLSWDDADSKLANKPDGSFLVRDSSDDRYILSLSFRSQSMTHHTRIEHYKGTFSFYSQPKSHGAGTIIEFIEKAMEHSRSGKFLYFLRPKAPGLPPAPVQLLFPVSRFRILQSMQHMCRFSILKHVRYDHIDTLPLPEKMKAYLKESQYYVEYILDEGNGEFSEQ